MGDSAAVTKFLRSFKEKLKVFDVLFLDDRKKNTGTLTSLEITPIARRQILERLELVDYSQGPLAEAFYGGESQMWVFGKIVKRSEVYIKITMGRPGNAVICISFHLAEFPMKYPFKGIT